jgi:hypothetical protein
MLDDRVAVIDHLVEVLLLSAHVCRRASVRAVTLLAVADLPVQFCRG